MTKKKTPSEELEITVKVHRYPAMTLFLRNAVGDGDIDGKEVEFSQNMSGEPIVRIANGRWYLVDIRSIVEAVYELEKDSGKTKEST